MSAHKRARQMAKLVHQSPDLYARVSRVERDRDGAFIPRYADEIEALERRLAEQEGE